MNDLTVNVEGKELTITNPDKLLWPAARISKKQYIAYLSAVAPYLLSYAKDRMLMIWRYPEGIEGKRLEERSIHGHAHNWVPRIVYQEKERILLNNAATLVWVANMAALELHVPFDTYQRKDFPTELVLDLDPPDEHSFVMASEVALRIKAVLDSLTLTSVPKTSGATGLQIYVPIVPKYPFEDTRLVNRFVAEFIQQQLPGLVTLDRVVRRRGGKLYLDYMQLWRGRTMPAPYSVRARKEATVSTPLLWEEIERGIRPVDFTMQSVVARLQTLGDLFSPITTDKARNINSLDEIIRFVKARR
ncbi:non-homologous end-joining DNA ligase [Paenibacillus allorhizosphaerae]|uniref:Bifunctional non-homologous end joining protein LigD n=1 Tax=Paenibacillus allorhizosphaerae TaxID=2849866 RepID=A0ABM8VAJ5_9BACL|nr:non-homologous end-joining DNA ligase [Paenibacillus allorhizosphaerae]CAG7616664.1 Bifunctional non-homologous end joining protein LigD [Paenibacillus allorhizosphaerae]